MHIRKDDTVEVLAGDDKGTRGRVLRVLREKEKVVVEGVNRVYRHLKPSKRNPQGGRLSKEMPVAASNVLLVCEGCGAATRVGVRYLPDGTKERY
jgi:large subunit ribosomal protein L24